MPRTACQVLTALGCCETALYLYIAGQYHKAHAGADRERAEV